MVLALRLRMASPPVDIQRGQAFLSTAAPPFAEPYCASHAVSDHTSVLALIEKRFAAPFGGDGDDRSHLTRRDRFARYTPDRDGGAAG
jgi:hypothetical protein